MVDRTSEFLKVVKDTCNDLHKFNKTSYNSSPSPFIIKASNTFCQLTQFEDLLQSLYERYIGYNRFFPSIELGDNRPLTAAERSELNRETLLFMTSVTDEIKDLKRMLDHKSHAVTSLQHQHDNEVVSFLLKKLGAFSAYNESLQRKQKAENPSPYRLLAERYTDKFAQDLAASTTSDGIDKQPASSVATVITSSFAQRYVDEIAPPAKMREYQSIATSHKESLLREARSLQVQFSDDMQESRRMEREVGDVSRLLTQFALLVESQSEVVGDIHDTAKLATSSVKQAGTELGDTVARTQSHQWSMVILILGLSLLILLLDALSP